jgi:hypothetical protein
MNTLPNLPTCVAVTAGVLWFAGYQQWAAAIIVLGAAVYVIELVVFPWCPCGGCNATGQQWSPFSRTFKTCSKCGGLRKRIRLGRRLWTSATDVNADRK